MNSQSKNQWNEEKSLKEKPEMSWPQLIQHYLAVFIFHLIFIVIFAYLISPWSKVDTITVEGNQDVYDQLIIDESSVKIGDPIYKSKQKFEQNEKEIVDQLTQISKSKFKIEEMNKVVIQVEEFNTVAYIAKDGAYLRVLENGSVLDELYSISLGNQLILSKFEEGEVLNAMIEELKEIKRPILNLISEVELIETRENPLFIRVYMNNGNRVLAKIPDFSRKIPYYPQMVQAVEGEKGVFDMEAGIYFIPFKDSKNPDSGVNEGEEQSLEDLVD